MVPSRRGRVAGAGAARARLYNAGRLRRRDRRRVGGAPASRNGPMPAALDRRPGAARALPPDRQRIGAGRGARSAPARCSSASLSPRDQVDLLIGLGQALYFGEVYGAGRGSLRHGAREGHAAERARSDRCCSTGGPPRSTARRSCGPSIAARRSTQRIGERMDRELHDDPSNARRQLLAVIAARGAGDLDLAWSAAISGWVRSTLNPATTEQLRADLDRVVGQALIPERCPGQPGPRGPGQVGRCCARVGAREAELEVARGGDRAGRCRAGE